VEWNIGEAAGALAAFALDRRVSPRSVHERTDLRTAFQETLVHEGVPLAWQIDVGVGHPAFAAVQRATMRGHMPLGTDLLFRPDAPVTPADWSAWGGTGALPPDRAGAALVLCGRT
jgi:hypothetical protein